MKLSSLLNPQLVLVGEEAKSKREIIHSLVEAMAAMFPTSLSVEKLKSKVEDREALGGTTFPTGIAIPHARLEGFNDLVIGVAIPKLPIEDNGVTINLFVLILTAANKPGLYLNCLSVFARLSHDKALFARLVRSKSAKDFIHTLEETHYTVKPTILVENIMTTSQVSINPSTKLKEINDILFKHHASYLPVVNDQGELVGEIRFLDILELVIPDYARNLGSLRFTRSLESFENLIDREKTITAADFMKNPLTPLGPKTTLLEAASVILKTKERHLAVVENKRLLGVISYMDILDKIIRN